jgi:epsilon-lactone hydrolase
MSQRSTAPWKRWLSVQAYGLVTRLYRASTPPQVARRRFERLATVTRESMRARHPSVSFSDHRAGSLWIEALRTSPAPRRVVLYLHGGGYFFGSPATYRDRARRVAFRCDAEVFVPDYRLAPEHPFPAALEDALAAWTYVASLRREVPIVVAGDSAGGGLTLSLLVALRDRGSALPACAFVFSPWTDLAGTGASMVENEGKDVWMTRRHIATWSRHYVGSGDAADPAISPVRADPRGLPPLLLIVGDQEVLLDDSLRVEASARKAGVDVEVLVGRGMQHDFPLTLPWLEESREAWEVAAAFVSAATSMSVPSVGSSSEVRHEREDRPVGIE